MKESYSCTACKYKFKKEQKPTKCPYCGKNDTIERDSSAQELLDSLTSMDDELEDTRGEMRKYR